MRDTLYSNVPFKLNEMTHHYGPHVHLVGNPFLLTQLATLCSKGVIQPQINRLVETLYVDLVKTVLNAEFPRKNVSLPTRMIDSTPQGLYQGEVIDPQVRVVTVNIARAGTLPSQVTYDLMNATLDPTVVRQDHIIMSRMIDAAEAVVGSEIGGAKIGGDVDDAFVLFPDPMGATGGSLSTAISLYKKKVPGTPRRIITLNLIVTPEYLRKMTTDHPDVIIYALRLDRGLSPPEVFGTEPGALWEKERGLDDRQYIVPGGGGFGEIMNNAYV
ncbi:Xanthine-guanine phosphoribosyltransferase [Myxococcus hansupus]|uniref:Xanthine-guanine phosphoribosyltransferase n=1 Tax=Pseudomyxococcus hansupus TaxID=1297742 RepID=A0A0H4WTL5_9BACT|nr:MULTISPECIES: uracil phosphoribosyltransferase [Myxococcus]NVJ09058.1 uracil phosphoribosyltransferase [Myxococcus sp. AM001]AKQ64903.1 Xanthine-guanine phosphoribosyltransferase [Myxococcus hansupus]NVJ02732.1 uracil phosphoribosyltransferase [Myxococcus sp. AM009]NVJ18942.1 uracil phosphoribosyltransferase [Myxococcus sp. AM010]WIG98567.1 uracil phosphoribosyltransferase [Myxococcus sp. SDU36]